MARHNKLLLKRGANTYTAQQEQDQAYAEAMLDDSPKKQQKIENIMDAVDDVKREPDHDFISKLITDYFSSKIFDVVCDFMVKKNNEEVGGEVLSEQDEDDGEYGYEDQHEEYFEDDGFEQQLKGKKGKQEMVNTRNKFVEERKKREKERLAKELKKWEFPSMIGSYHKYVIPALEFSKFISVHIFGLDEAFYLEAHQLKVNLLRMIRCKEFSEEVQQGIEPSLILVIPDVICELCQTSMDLDICRDFDLNQENVDGESVPNWACKSCNENLNKHTIERRLLDLVNRRLISYQMQDLVCKQCRMVKNSVVSKYCECTGAYLQTVGNTLPEKLKNPNLLNNMTDVKLFMQLMRNFASYHKLHILRDTTDQILSLIN